MFKLTDFYLRNKSVHILQIFKREFWFNFWKTRNPRMLLQREAKMERDMEHGAIQITHALAYKRIRCRRNSFHKWLYIPPEDGP
jgi:hypothetical protein